MMMKPAFPSGAFVISLDFELNWGVRDSKAPGEYRNQILGGRRAVPAILESFRKHTIHATWATVGFLFCRSREELLSAAPPVWPVYRNRRLCPYRVIPDIGSSEQSDPAHYAPSLIATIRSCPFQEIASHTFSHYYCLEPGQDRAAFEADLEALAAIAGRAGMEIRSIVFPRNQVNRDYLDSCARMGLLAYRGNPRSWMFSPGGSRLKRLLRLADAYLPLSGDNSYQAERPGALVNIPASRFLRPYSARLRALDGWRRRRIERDLTSAAEKSHIYHLWWHPHNFGVDLPQNLQFLEDVLGHFDRLRSRCGMESLNMVECAGRLTLSQETANAVAVLSIHS